MMKDDPTIEAVREARHRISEIVGHDPRKLVEHYRRLAHISQLAAQTLGSVETARVWLGRANRALGGNTPLSLLDTEIGARQVEEVLARIDSGMYS